jgi:hypothetical protein
LLPLPNDRLVLYENTAVQLANKKANKLITAVQFLVLKIVNEQVWELDVNKLFEYVADEQLSQGRLKLV